MDTTNNITHTYLGLDIAKATLQVATPEGQNLSLPNDRHGHRRLIALARKAHTRSGQPALIVCEATGGYERSLRTALAKADIACCLLSADRVRAFARAQGLRAKTDPIDAALLLRFAQQSQLQPTPPPNPAHAHLATLVERRSQTVEAISIEQTRLQNSDPAMHPSLKRSIAFHKKEQARLEKDIRAFLAKHPTLQEAATLIRAIDGLGEVTAWAILAHLPELPGLARNQATALAGLAPYNRDSGQTQGNRHIHAGRAKLRKALYMPALVATRYNPHIKAYYQALIARGKPAKCALVAVMRKLILHIRATLIQNQIYSLA